MLGTVIWLLSRTIYSWSPLFWQVYYCTNPFGKTHTYIYTCLRNQVNWSFSKFADTSQWHFEYPMDSLNANTWTETKLNSIEQVWKFQRTCMSKFGLQLEEFGLIYRFVRSTQKFRYQIIGWIRQIRIIWTIGEHSKFGVVSRVFVWVNVVWAWAHLAS